MANVVICESDSSNVLKNNYYYALSTDDEVARNPPQLPISHTGIADSSASGFFFTNDAPNANRNQQAPTIGVRLANGRAKRSIASATLALVPSLPPAAMQGHVMPFFTNSLIGLGPFVGMGCTIVFTASYPSRRPLPTQWLEGRRGSTTLAFSASTNHPRQGSGNSRRCSRKTKSSVGPTARSCQQG